MTCLLYDKYVVFIDRFLINFVVKSLLLCDLYSICFIISETGMAVCVYFSNNQLNNRCDKGDLCPYRFELKRYSESDKKIFQLIHGCNTYLMGSNFRHIIGEKSVVCKHWLRGLCKKGDQCEFLHEYDLQKMPECYFYSKYS